MADRSEEEAKSAAGKEPFESLIPLKEVIAMANGFAVKGKRTEREYMRLLVQLGPEFEVLRKIPVEQISRTAGEQTGCLVDKLRKGKIKDRAFSLRFVSPGTQNQTAISLLLLYNDKPVCV